MGCSALTDRASGARGRVDCERQMHSTVDHLADSSAWFTQLSVDVNSLHIT
jgi:hypothetical protein